MKVVYYVGTGGKHLRVCVKDCILLFYVMNSLVPENFLAGGYRLVG